MSCGIEHLSNCHGELTGLALLVGGVVFWLRTSFATFRFRVKDWLAKRAVRAAKDKEFP